MHPPPIPPTLKRSRSDYDVPVGHDFSSFYPRDEERGGYRAIRDAESLGASYDRYLRNGQISSYGASDIGRPLTGGLPSRPIDDPRIMGAGGIDPAMSGKSRNIGFGGGRPDMPLPPDASNTLFVEGLPADCTQREVSHIFRPFVGFKEVRLVKKEARHSGGDPVVLCFVDFYSSSEAAVALDALQGYKFDEHDRDSPKLRLQFARYPGPRSERGPRGKR